MVIDVRAMVLVKRPCCWYWLVARYWWDLIASKWPGQNWGTFPQVRLTLDNHQPGILRLNMTNIALHKPTKTSLVCIMADWVFAT